MVILAKRTVFIIGLLLFVGCNAHAEEDIKKHVRVLSDEIGRRNAFHYENLNRAADYIKDEFKSYGYEPEEQVYFMETRKSEKRPFRNIIAVKRGKGEGNKVIICCAHYDSRETPGADDNASDVAAVLELARLIHKDELRKTVKFIAFTNEELELVFEDRDMGSFRYAGRARERGEDIKAVICLDMIGYYSDIAGSQKRPFPLIFFYPDKGNFVGFGSDIASYGLLRDVVTEFKKASDIPVEYLAAPVPLEPEIVTSDNRSFWTFGYSSVWVSDTCIYRNSNMHTENDKYGTLDYQKMSRVVDGVYGVVLKLAK